MTFATSDQPPAWTWADAASIVFLVLVCAAVRGPWLTVVAFEPDECQFASHAAYLVANDLSAFETPYGPVYSIWLYGQFAQWFGPNEMLPVRCFVAGLCLAVALLLYVIVRRSTSRWCAALAGMLFMALANGFEGLAANREWFALPWLMLGLKWYLDSRSTASGRSARLLVQAGVCGGLAFWFKEQSAYLLFVIPLDLLYRAIASRALRDSLVGLLCYSAGALGGLITLMLPLAYYGTLVDHLAGFVQFHSEYVGTSSHGTIVGRISHLWHHFYELLPFRSLFIVAYVMAAAVGVASVQYFRNRLVERPWCDSTWRVLSIHLVCAMVAIRAGERYFPHYYIYLLPALAGLTAGGVAMVVDQLRTGRHRAFSLCLAVLLALDLLGFIPMPTARIALVMAIAVVGIGLAGWAWRRVRPASGMDWVLGTFLFAAMACSFVPLVAQTMNWQRSAHLIDPSALDFSELVDDLTNRAHPGDRLYVWGWRPELYVLTRMTPASQFTAATLIMGDVTDPARPSEFYNRHYAEILMSDLRRERPRFIVDAWLRSLMGAVYRLEHFAPLERFLADNYRYLTTSSHCDVYVRVDDKSESHILSRSQRLDLAFRQLDAMIADEFDNIHYHLIRAALLQQAGRSDEAAETYRFLMEIVPEGHAFRSAIVRQWQAAPNQATSAEPAKTSSPAEDSSGDHAGAAATP